MDDEKDVSLSLADLWKVFKNNIIIIIAATIFCSVIAFIFAEFVVKPTYTATSTMYVRSESSTITLSDLSTAAALTNDYEVIIKSKGTLILALEKLKNDLPDLYTLSDDYSLTIVNKCTYTLTQLKEMISIANPSNSRMLQITVTSVDARFSADFANALLDKTTNRVIEIIDVSIPYLVESAEPNYTATSPNKTLYLLIGALIGLFGTYGVCFLIYILKSSFDNEDDVTRVLGIDTLGVISDGEDLEQNSQISAKNTGVTK